MEYQDWYGGRIMGGGFGGNTINLIKEGKELDYVKWICNELVDLEILLSSYSFARKIINFMCHRNFC